LLLAGSLGAILKSSQNERFDTIVTGCIMLGQGTHEMAVLSGRPLALCPVQQFCPEHRIAR